ncbi:MAG TPA: D-glycero-beta-D-manno-heptose-7-phosphate kinase [Candidatus Cloacimonetes bacterium]|nr:D-glycero-beta-D-manno-heptose-7-phosphate kinase [Candidatus Cloacimonadota bacterium]HEX37607.1 D-glycero-beta-D-manno-heptose-7-phosphate kinase [Candidatus Cloacimonadota bacterium]
MQLDEIKLNEIFNKIQTKKILVVGDLMLDHYIIGDVERISPEAPVQVVKVENEKFGPGGAANVAQNIKALGAEPLIIGMVGEDENGSKLKQMFIENHISDEGIVASCNHPTTQKTRVIARSQQLVRIDFEKDDELDSEGYKKIKAYAEKKIEEIDGIILQDYNKGLLSKKLIHFFTSLAKEHDIPIGVDPKAKNFFEYKDVTVFKPNKLEAEKNLQFDIEHDDDLQVVAQKLMDKLHCSYIVITLGSKGMFIYDDQKRNWLIPTFSQEVYDVSGAGDTVISTLMLGLSAGCDIKEASIIANHAAGVVCGKVGAATASPAEILASFKKWNNT